MSFIPPLWYEGMFILAGYHLGIPILIGLIAGIITKLFFKKKSIIGGVGTGIIVTVIAILIMMPVGTLLWHWNYEVPSVQTKIITVSEFQPAPDVGYTNQGSMVISNADQIMIIDSEGNGYFNKESGWFAGFSKWDTRDILNSLKINGTYKIKYYGWRNPRDSSFPNILSIEEVIDESNATRPNYNDLFGVKLTGL